MILNKQELKEIVERKSVFKDGNYHIEHSSRELLNVISTYIFDKTGKKVSEMKEPRGNTCGYFLNFMVGKGVNPLQAVNHANDFELLNYMSYIAFKYYIEKFKDE